jgi:hypothetical protein
LDQSSLSDVLEVTVGRWPGAGVSRAALQAPADDLVMRLGEVAAAGLPDLGDRQVPPGGALASWSGGGGGFGVGGGEHPKPLRLARAEPIRYSATGG